MEGRGALVEERAIETETFHHPQEELRMWGGAREASRLLLVEILGEGCTHVGQGRDLSERTSEEDRKVSNVDGVLVLKVREELRSRETWLREPRIGPVVLPVHHREQARGDRGEGEGFVHHPSSLHPRGARSHFGRLSVGRRRPSSAQRATSGDRRRRSARRLPAPSPPPTPPVLPRGPGSRP